MPTSLVERNPEAHLHLLNKVASGFFCPGMSREDLAQEGFPGLKRACETFDETRGVPFERWASKCIRGAIAKAIHATGRNIRIPVDQFHAALSDDVDGLTPDQLSRRDAAARSLKAMVGDHTLEEGNLGGVVPDHRREFDRLEFELDVAPRIASLPNLHREVLVRSFGLIDGVEESPRVIGRSIRRSPHEVTVILEEALVALRQDSPAADRPEQDEQPAVFTPQTNHVLDAPPAVSPTTQDGCCDACGRKFKNRKYFVCYYKGCRRFGDKSQHATARRRPSPKTKAKSKAKRSKPTPAAAISVVTKNTPPPVSRASFDPRREAAAMAQAAELLGSLPQDAAARVVSWLACHFATEGGATHAIA